MNDSVNGKIISCAARLKEGEAGAFEQLYGLTYNQVYFLALKILKNHNDALEVVQETFLSVYQNIGGLYNPEVFHTWLSRIVVHKCMDLRRSQQKFADPEPQDPEIDKDNFFDRMEENTPDLIPHEALDREETRNMMMALIDRLPVAQRTALLLYYYQQLSVEEIAAVMDCPVATVKSRLQYARRQIKKGVENYQASGIKLYNLAAGPALIYLLDELAKSSVLPPSETSHIFSAVQQAVSGAVTSTPTPSTGGSSAAGSGQAVGHPAQMPAHTQPHAAGNAHIVHKGNIIAKVAHASLRTKIVVGILAAAFITAGIAVPGFVSAHHAVPAVSTSTAASSAMSSHAASSEPESAPKVVTAYSYDNRQTKSDGTSIGLKLSYPNIVSTKPGAVQLNNSIMDVKDQAIKENAKISDDYVYEANYRSFVYKNVLTIALSNRDSFLGNTSYRFFYYDFMKDQTLTQADVCQMLSVQEADVLQKAKDYFISQGSAAEQVNSYKIAGIFPDNDGSIVVDVDLREDNCQRCLKYDKSSGTFSQSNALPETSKPWNSQFGSSK